MTPLDRAILELGRDDFHLLRPLLNRFPQGGVCTDTSSDS